MKNVIPLFLVITTASLLAMEKGGPKFYQLPTDQIPKKQYGAMNLTPHAASLLRAVRNLEFAEAHLKEGKRQEAVLLYELVASQDEHREQKQLALQKMTELK